MKDMLYNNYTNKWVIHCFDFYIQNMQLDFIYHTIYSYILRRTRVVADLNILSEFYCEIHKLSRPFSTHSINLVTLYFINLYVNLLVILVILGPVNFFLLGLDYQWIFKNKNKTKGRICVDSDPKSYRYNLQTPIVVILITMLIKHVTIK